MNRLQRTEPNATPPWVRAFWIGALLALAAFAALHLTGHGLGHHGGAP